MAKPDQGGVELLDDPAAEALLQSRQPAHLAYTWTDGTPRCTPSGFTGTAARSSWPAPPTLPRVGPSRRLPVAVTIDSDEWPYQVLMIRGRVHIDQVEGVAPEYRVAATRYSARSRATGGVTSCRRRW